VTSNIYIYRGKMGQLGANLSCAWHMFEFLSEKTELSDEVVELQNFIIL
jgi:hypothetical protein